MKCSQNMQETPYITVTKGDNFWPSVETDIMGLFKALSSCFCVMGHFDANRSLMDILLSLSY